MYSLGQSENRSEYSLIIESIPEYASVVDLGCGDGALLSLLHERKKIKGVGIEVSRSGCNACKDRGVSVVEARIDEPLPFHDDQFDFSVCNVTIQMVMYPEVLVHEMMRISRKQIISFPNFGFWKNRLELLFRGRMPQKMLFGYKWHTTGHIHQLSLNDFEEFITSFGALQIVEKKYLPVKNPLKSILAALFPNLFHPIGIYLLSKK